MDQRVVSINAARAIASIAISFLVFEVMLRALGESHTLEMWFATILGMAGGVYFRVQWGRKLLSRRGYVIMAGALPFVIGLGSVYVYAKLH